MANRQRPGRFKGSRRRLDRIRARDYWSWRMTLALAAFVIALIWL